LQTFRIARVVLPENPNHFLTPTRLTFDQWSRGAWLARLGEFQCLPYGSIFESGGTINTGAPRTNLARGKLKFRRLALFV